ncbi:LysR family transcriptional regulator [Conexibacter sp. SYSU D00693]|uniref:LysR family transcriptional regulator n=1 Tax=Conexibacter sp. SYSU D00693 TaxID=2812560 RepID=UPI00196B23A6|nr:LysR family transcriptional regulator [Conexibacter sp. SYSU D00693]
MLDVRRMRVLHEVARTGSFAAAASELWCTPSAVSQQIAALEREAGVVLVERGARGARLTAAGAVLDRHAAVVLGQLAAARAELDDLAQLRTGRLRMTAFESAWALLVPAALARLRAEHPDLELDLAEADPDEGLAALRSGERDLVLVFEPNDLPGDALAGALRTEVCRDELHAVVPAGHPLAGAPQIALDDLAQESWVVPTESCERLVRGACAVAGFEPRVVFSSADYGAVQGFVGAGAGVALVPRLALSESPRVVPRPLAPRPDGSRPGRTIAAVTASEDIRPPAASAMLDALRTAAAQLA